MLDICIRINILIGFFPGVSVVKNPPANTGDTDLIPELGRSLPEQNGNPLQYSCLGNPMDRGAWWATVHGAANTRDITERLTHRTASVSGSMDTKELPSCCACVS